MRLAAALVLYAAVIVSGCVANHAAKTPHETTASEALLKAVKVFPEERYGSIAAYTIEIKSFDSKYAKPEGECWLVHFRRSSPPVTVGAYCNILVSKASGEVSIQHGK